MAKTDPRSTNNFWLALSVLTAAGFGASSELSNPLAMLCFCAMWCLTIWVQLDRKLK